MRIKRGMLVGLVVALAYSITASVINPLSFPRFHLIVNWQAFLTTWVAMSVGLGLAGAIVAWFTENNGAIVGGGAMVTGLILIAVIIAYITIQNKIQLLFVYIVAVLPLFGASIVFAWALRWAINQYSQIKREEKLPIRKKMLRQLICLVILAGLIPGIFNRFDLTTLDSLTRVTQRLQSTGEIPESIFRFPEENIRDLDKHLGMDYTLYSRPSTQSVGFIDVTIYFKDGYTLTCLIPTSMDLYMFASYCNEGSKMEIIQTPE